jgi:AraC family transcriptional regulator
MAIDPDIFSISRPPLGDYRSFVEPRLIVETYRSAAGQMISHGPLHRISVNRTAHRRYVCKLGSDVARAVARPPFTLGFEPATVALEVEGDEADYVSIFQSPALYRSIGGADFAPERWDGDRLSAAADPTTLQVVLALALAVEDPAVDALLMQHLGIALACRVVRLLGARPQAPQPHALPPRTLRRVIDQIEGFIGDAGLSVETLASTAHLSPYHFSRAFKAATGEPPHRFILRRRVGRAKLHLAEADATLADIAYACGFASQAHFCGVFRRLTGMTPKQYRGTVRG